MELYAAYIKERQDAEIVYNSVGFMSYRVFPEGVFILDAYVYPDCRKEGITRDFLDMIVSKTGARKLYTSTEENANNWQESEKAILALGFKKIREQGRTNYYSKEIK